MFERWLEIPPHQSGLIIGPRRAGKTTLTNVMDGVHKPSSGTVYLNGHRIDTLPPYQVARAGLGRTFQVTRAFRRMTVLENLTFFADVFQVGRQEREERITRLLDFARLTRFKKRRAAHLSGGMQKKLALACTLIHAPEIIFLDEPTTGVDPVSRREFWDILTDLNLDGATIVVSTPYMDEADRCSQVGLMYAGRLVVCDTPQRIRAGLEGELIELQPDDWQTARDVIITLPGVLEVQTYGELLHVLVDAADERIPALEAALREHGLTLRNIRRATPRMEEAFISLIKRMEEE